MKCEVTSHTTHEVLISKEISYRSYKEICRGEPKKVNFGYNNSPKSFKAENNTLMPYPPIGTFLFGEISKLSFDWEVKFSTSFSQSTTLNPTGWTVTTPMDGLMSIWEGGLAVWERFEELSIECDD